MTGLIIAAIWLAAAVGTEISSRTWPGQAPPHIRLALDLSEPIASVLAVKLAAYSFIHKLDLQLMVNLTVLAPTVVIATTWMSLAAFVRLYSLGSVGAGMIYLVGSTFASHPKGLIGADLALEAMLGAMAAWIRLNRADQLGQRIAGHLLLIAGLKAFSSLVLADKLLVACMPVAFVGGAAYATAEYALLRRRHQPPVEHDGG